MRDTRQYVAPSEFLNIDETLYPISNRIAFCQYNPNKPRMDFFEIFE